jgi:transcriptional regulator with XRE-family HTH domain
MAVPKNMNLVGPQLQKLRKDRRWTQHDLSTKLRSMGWKVSRTGVAQMEVTQKRITDCDLIFLAKALNVNIVEFFPASFTPEIVRTKVQSRRLMLWHPSFSRLPTVRAAKSFLSKAGYFLRWKIFGFKQ